MKVKNLFFLALMLATQNCALQSQTIRSFMKKLGLVNPQQELNDAIHTGNVQAAADALSDGADPNAPFHILDMKATPLRLAIARRSFGWKFPDNELRLLQFAQVFDAHKLDINAADEKGMTHFMHALGGNHFRLAEWLLQRGADTEARDKAGKSIYHYLLYAGEPNYSLTSEDEKARDALYEKLHASEFFRTIIEMVQKK